MKLLLHGERCIDFEAPVYMSDQQRKKFIKFMRKLVPSIKVVYVQEKERKGPGGGQIKPWTKHEFGLLLKTDDNEMLEKKLGRSMMSIRLQRGQLQPEFFRWAEREGYVIPMDNRKREPLIKKFLEAYYENTGGP